MKSLGIQALSKDFNVGISIKIPKGRVRNNEISDFKCCYC